MLLPLVINMRLILRERAIVRRQRLERHDTPQHIYAMMIFIEEDDDITML